MKKTLRRKNKTVGVDAMADVVLVGAGPAGMIMALTLAQHGFAVTLVDRTVPEDLLDETKDGRTLALAHAPINLLKALAVWPRLEGAASPIKFIRCADQGSPAVVDFDSRAAGGAAFGYMVRNVALRRALCEAVRAEKSITLCAPFTPRSITSDVHRVVIASATQDIMARLLIASDGKYSWCREQLGIAVRKKDYNQTALVCNVAHRADHQQIAVEHFLAGGPLALLPLSGRQSAVVWTERPAQAEKLFQSSAEDFCHALEKYAGTYLGSLELVSPRQLWPLTLSHASTYVAGRAVLIGDAAHAIHPIAGQGLNLTMRDIAALAQLLVQQARLGLDIGDPYLLKKYQRHRRLDNWMMIAVTDGLDRLFSQDVPALNLLRHLGMATVQRVKPIKNILMKSAMGLVLPDNPLLAGKPL